jgi:hypothetical protein
MKPLFFSGVIIGFAAVLAAAGYYPWVDHVRIPSRTSVQVNGGRAEQFLIRLPADRLAVVANARSGARLTTFPAAVSLPDAPGEELVLLEHFKIRDARGDVIGIASRHTVEAQQRLETVWSVVIPSRGAILLRGAATASELDRRLLETGFQAGRPWAGNVRIPASDMDPAGDGELIAGTGEFEALTGDYREAWQVTGVGATGELRGTIQLNTVFRGR